MPAMKQIVCKCGCGRKKMVRIADIKRGWGKFYSKSCKARWQESRTGQYKRLLSKEYGYSQTFNDAHLFSNEEHNCSK